MSLGGKAAAKFQSFCGSPYVVLFPNFSNDSIFFLRFYFLIVTLTVTEFLPQVIFTAAFFAFLPGLTLHVILPKASTLIYFFPFAIL